MLNRLLTRGDFYLPYPGVLFCSMSLLSSLCRECSRECLVVQMHVISRFTSLTKHVLPSFVQNTKYTIYHLRTPFQCSVSFFWHSSDILLTLFLHPPPHAHIHRPLWPTSPAKAKRRSSSSGSRTTAWWKTSIQTPARGATCGMQSRFITGGRWMRWYRWWRRRLYRLIGCQVLVWYKIDALIPLMEAKALVTMNTHTVRRRLFGTYTYIFIQWTWTMIVFFLSRWFRRKRGKREKGKKGNRKMSLRFTLPIHSASPTFQRGPPKPASAPAALCSPPTAPRSSPPSGGVTRTRTMTTVQYTEREGNTLIVSVPRKE